MVRRARAVLGAIVVGLAARGVAGADDAPGMAVPAPTAPPVVADDVELTTWEGFLWRSAEGWVQMGTPLASERGSPSRGPRVVDGPVSTRLADLETGAVLAFVKESTFSFGAALTRDDWEPQRRGEPRLLVKLRGRAGPTIVHLSDVGPSETEPAVSLRDAHVVSIERLDPAWLAAWRAILKAPGSRFTVTLEDPIGRGDDDAPARDAQARKAFLRTAIDGLVAMRAVPGPKEESLAAARAIDPGVRASTKFRHRVEFEIERFVIAEAKALGVALPVTFVPSALPPDDVAVLKWFADAKTRAEFLARAAKVWSGDPEDLDFGSIVYDEHATDPGEPDLATIRDTWSEARYARIREATLEAWKADDAPGAVPATAPDTELSTWDGYLFWDGEQRLRLGAPIVGKDVKGRATRVVGGPLGWKLGWVAGWLEKLTVPTDDASLSFECEFEGDVERRLVRAPKYLVRVRGDVDRFERSSSGGRGSEGVEMLGDAELVAVEAVDPEWLRAYFVLIDHDASIRDSSKEGESPSADVRKRRLTVAADALKAMRAVPLASDTEPVAGRRSGAGPRASTKFRHRIEIQIERSILTEAKSLGVTLPASFMPTKLPPTASDAKSWFAEAKTLAQFLSLASRAWNGDAEDLDVEYLAIDGHGRTRTELADLETIRATWSEARYSRVRAATVGVK